MAAPRHAALILDANTGAVLHQRDPDAARHPASLTKMMTLYLAFEQIEQGRLSMTTRITVSAAAAGAAPTRLGLEAGSSIALGDAIKALIVKSANDMAVAVAEHIGGSEEKFAGLMTEKARALGMRATTFKNASGLPHDEQITTARDMLTLALALQDHFPKHYPLFAARTFTYDGHSHRTHNTLLTSYEGTDGIKTGYTRASGFNLVSSVRRGQKHVVGAVFGGASAASRNTEMRTLLTLALTKASPTKTRQAAPVLIARARPAAEPKTRLAEAAPALKSNPELVRRAVPRATAATRIAPPPPAPAATAQPIDPTPAAEPPGAKIEIAKVRSVQITPIVRGPRAEPSAAEPAAAVEPPAQASAPAPLSPAPLSLAAAEPSEPAARTSLRTPDLRRAQDAAEPATTPPEIAKHTVEPVAPYVPPVAAIAPPAAPARAALVPPLPPAPVLAQRPPLSAVATAPQRGAPPSTFQQQAAALEGARPQAAATPAFRLAGPAPPATAPGVQIQIGAYASQADAERQLAATRAKAGGLLNAYQPVSQPVHAGGRALYRARYAGFDQQTAINVCTELRRRQIDCLVTRD